MNGLILILISLVGAILAVVDGLIARNLTALSARVQSLEAAGKPRKRSRTPGSVRSASRSDQPATSPTPKEGLASTSTGTTAEGTAPQAPAALSLVEDCGNGLRP